MRTRKTTIILISGKAGSGKSTTADYLRSLIPHKFPDLTVAKYSLADPIKYIAKAFMTWDGEKDDKGRKLLQDVGKVGREYNENVWVKHLLNQLDRNFGNDKQLYPTNFVIVDDWRFPNEKEYLASNPMIDVVTVRVFGRGGLSGDTANDVSETSLPEVYYEVFENNPMDTIYDMTIQNEGSLELLENKIDIALSVLKEQYIVE